MRKLLLVVAVCLASVLPAAANKVSEVKFRSKEPIQKVFTEALRAISLQGYTVKFTDASGGTIQANKQAWGGYGEYASVLVTVRKDGDAVLVDAIFTRNSGTMGGGQPPEWAKKFGDTLKKTIPDLERES
jgi:hypothetical protein